MASLVLAPAWPIASITHPTLLFPLLQTRISSPVPSLGRPLRRLLHRDEGCLPSPSFTPDGLGAACVPWEAPGRTWWQKSALVEGQAWFHLWLSKWPWSWDFPGGPVVRTPCFQFRGTGSILGWGSKIPHALVRQKTKQKTLTLTNLCHLPRLPFPFLYMRCSN